MLQAFADRVTEDYDAVFMAAVQRAVAGVDGEVEECRRQELEPMRPRRDSAAREEPPPRPYCVSKDLNGVLAGVVDADRVLAAALDEIVGREWPTITILAEPQAPIGRGERWLRVRDLISAAAKGPLYTIDRDDDDARARIAATLEDDATPEQLAALEPQMQQLTERTAAARAALAAPVLEAAANAMARWKREAPAAWCANPEVLGGCTGMDASAELVGRLVDDKRVQKAFPE